MKLNLPVSLLTAAVLMTLAGTAHAQILWGAANNISGPSDISALGTSVDALQVSPNNQSGPVSTAYTVGDTTFNALNNSYSGDGFITPQAISGGWGTYSFGGPSTSNANYNAALSNFSYNGDSQGFYVTLGSGTHPLTVGEKYSVEVWDYSSANYSMTLYSGTDTTAPLGSVTISGAGQWAVGDFVANATTQEFALQAPSSADYGGGFTAVALRDLGRAEAPEPSAYALMLASLGALVFGLRVSRNRARL